MKKLILMGMMFSMFNVYASACNDLGDISGTYQHFNVDYDDFFDEDMTFIAGTISFEKIDVMTYKMITNYRFEDMSSPDARMMAAMMSGEQEIRLIEDSLECFFKDNMNPEPRNRYISIDNNGDLILKFKNSISEYAHSRLEAI